MRCDTAGDSRVPRAMHSRWDICLRGGTALAMALLASWATPAGGQIPGAPVLQNAWATPGIVGAIDVGGGSGASVYAAAVSWAPGSGHFQLSGGGGIETGSGVKSRGVYGVRAAIPLGGASSTFGFAAFAGVGGGPSRTTSVATCGGLLPCPVCPTGATCPVVADSVTNTAEVPVGVAAGWRHAIGATHGVSLYATPSYVFFSGGTKGRGLFRAALGGDVGITSSLGATLGIEFGGKRQRGLGGPTGSLYGFGLSYALGHR
jgi:hypothetical protein